MDKVIGTVEKILDIKVEPTTKDLVVRIPATTSHGHVVLDKKTEVKQLAVANGENNITESDFSNEDEVETEVQSSSQCTSNQPRSVVVDKTDGGLIDQMRKLFELTEQNINSKMN